MEQKEVKGKVINYLPERLQNQNFNFVLLKKGGKKPFENDWQRRIHRFDEPILKRHIENGGNIGVQSNNSNIEIDGLNYFLIIIDFDTLEFQEKVINEFPETFTTTSGSEKKCVHLWFACDKNKAFKVKDEQGKTLSDIIGEGNQIVIQPSRHQSGSSYTVVKDKPIVFFPYKDIERILKPHHKFETKKVQSNNKEKKPYIKKEGVNILDMVKQSLSIDYVLNHFGVDTSRNPTKCPFHDSVGGANLGFDNEVAHCFNCDNAWNIFSFTQQIKNCDFKEALEYLAELAGLDKELEEERKKYKAEIVFEEKKNEEEKDGIIWSDNIDTWELAKKKSYIESKASDKLKFYAHKNDKIKGKPQILDNNKKTNLTLLQKMQYINPKTEEETITLKFIGDPYKKGDGVAIESFNKYFWVYMVIDNDIEYMVLTNEKLSSSEVHLFEGMKIISSNSKELSTELKLKGISEVFLVNSLRPAVKIIPKEEIIPFTESTMEEMGYDNEEFRDFFFDLLFTHEDGYIYRQPKDYMLMRHAQLLSGKVNGYPLSTLSLGVAGCSKTMEVECIDQVFSEGVLEAGNSTPKALVPSFKEKPASSGFILSRNRVALVDELMKMVDNQIMTNGSIGEVRNQLSQLNYLLEHKKRSVGSGNNNAFTGQTTAKVIMVGNPAGKMNYLADHLKVLDESTLSRFFIWIKGFEHKRFVQSNKPVKSPDTLNQNVNTNTNKKLYREDAFEDLSFSFKVSGDFIYYYYLTIYDSCQAFTCEVDYNEMERIFQEVLSLVPLELKNVWAARGRHHTELIIDGITKWNRIFVQQRSDFKASKEDYEQSEKILIKMAQSWSEGLQMMY